jgi:monofunctional biosynthetic peptidoglycan transglycosylase
MTLRHLARRAGVALAWVAALTLAMILALRWIPPPTTSWMLAYRLTHPGGAIAYEWVPWEEISPQAALAVVAAEDQRFFDHQGFDLSAIRDVLRGSRSGERMRGASTITQQVAKNLFLWSDRSFLRKGLEAGLTVFIELLWPKRRILEVYLNVAQLGPGTFGFEAASQRYFRKSAAALTPSEAALLAAVLPNPERLRAERPSAYVRQRQAWVLRQMRLLGGTALLRSIDG